MSQSTIKDYYLKHKTQNGDVGLELEVEFQEGELPFADVTGPWRTVGDDSLRNGIEYVTRAPLKIEGLKDKISGLTDILNTKKLAISHRCSVHVHRNVQNFTPIEVWNTLLAYWILEAPLLAFCGQQRRSNLFCLGVHEANGILNFAYTDMDNQVPFSTFSQTSCKYGGQNLHTISRLGTIEYRGMRGTTDPDLISLWATTLYEIGERARKFSDPAALMDFYLDSEKDQFLMAMLPAEFINHIKETDNYVSLIKRNVLQLATLAYINDDWQQWQTKLKVPTPKVNKTPMDIYLEMQQEALYPPVAMTGSTINSWNIIDD